jgi:serine/threonine protein phosphatase PrpC
MGRRWRGEGAQHQGARPYQEDSWALRGLADDALLAVLADGMGGHTGGSIASRLAVGAFIMAVEQGGSLAEALQAANLAIAEGVSRKPELRGMGSTLVAVIDQGSRSLQPGGRLLVCSDGIQSLDDARIAEKAARPAQELIEAVLAVAAPAQDNVTVIKLEREE